MAWYLLRPVVLITGYFNERLDFVMHDTLSNGEVKCAHLYAP